MKKITSIANLEFLMNNKGCAIYKKLDNNFILMKMEQVQDLTFTQLQWHITNEYLYAYEEEKVAFRRDNTQHSLPSDEEMTQAYNSR